MLIALIVGEGLALSILLAQIPGTHTGLESLWPMMIDSTIIMVAVAFLPLLWWRNKAGFIGAIGIGIFEIIWMILALSALVTGQIATEWIAIFSVIFIFAVVLIITSRAAWKEKT